MADFVGEGIAVIYSAITATSLKPVVLPIANLL